jgi:hypothetical protein
MTDVELAEMRAKHRDKWRAMQTERYAKMAERDRVRASLAPRLAALQAELDAVCKRHGAAVVQDEDRIAVSFDDVTWSPGMPDLSLF